MTGNILKAMLWKEWRETRWKWLAFACAFLTGLIFGYLPARKAAALDPVVALASE